MLYVISTADGANRAQIHGARPATTAEILAAADGLRRGLDPDIAAAQLATAHAQGVRFPHVLEPHPLGDGDCIHCGDCGDIADQECRERLLERLTALESVLVRLSVQAEQAQADAPPRDPVWRQLGYWVREAAWHYGLGREP